MAVLKNDFNKFVNAVESYSYNGVMDGKMIPKKKSYGGDQGSWSWEDPYEKANWWTDPTRNEKNVSNSPMANTTNTVFKTVKEEKETKNMTNRMALVKIVVLDLDKRVPLKDRLVHETEMFWTDDSNEDIYYSLNLKEKVEAHNVKRAAVEWEQTNSCDGSLSKVTGLPPVKISELKKEVIYLVKFDLK